MTTSSNSPYWLTDPLEIGSALKELLRSTDKLDIWHGEEPVPSFILAVDTRARTFQFRPYGGDAEFQSLVGAGTLKFDGSAKGAPITFAVNGLKVLPCADDNTQAGPVFEAAFPAKLYRLQRREYFRARASPPNTRVAVWTPPAGDDIQFRIHDVSQAGLGMRSSLQAAALPEIGQKLCDVVLDFNEYGTMRAQLQVISCHELVEFDIRLGHVKYMHLGCEFSQADPKRDIFLQKLVYQLEQASRV